MDRAKELQLVRLYVEYNGEHRIPDGCSVLYKRGVDCVLSLYAGGTCNVCETIDSIDYLVDVLTRQWVSEDDIDRWITSNVEFYGGAK